MVSKQGKGGGTYSHHEIAMDFVNECNNACYRYVCLFNCWAYVFYWLAGKEEGKEAYAIVFIILLVLGYCVYQGIIKFQQ